MERSKEVVELLYDWYRDHTRPASRWTTDLSMLMTVAKDLGETAGRILDDMAYNPKERLDSLQVANLIAAMFISSPSPERGDAPTAILEKLELVLDTEDRVEPALSFFYGCILGLLRAAVELQKLGDISQDLEDNLWRLVLKAADRADFHSKERHHFDYRGQLSELMGRYLKSQPEADQCYRQWTDTDFMRWERLKAAASGLSEFIYRHGHLCSFSAGGVTRPLLNEILYKVFAGVNYMDRVWMVEEFLKQNEEK